MEQFILTLFCMYGIMFTLKEAQLPGLVQVRKFLYRFGFFHKLLSCSFCTGFHAGWLTYLLLNHNLFAMQPWIDSACYILIYSFVSATFCYLLDTIIVKLES